MIPKHIPVLAKEVIEGLDPKPGQHFVDGTVGLGGHAALILERTSPDGKLLAFDKDAANLATAKENLKRFGDRVTFINDSYANLAEYVHPHGFDQVHGILLDLGFSSVHIEDASRGFSFQQSGPLDMRYDKRQELTAEVIINSWRAEDLADIFHTYGEERHAHKIAKRIVDERRRERIQTTERLAQIIKDVVPHSGKPMHIHPATRVFQALRIAVNDELMELERTLPTALHALAAGGRLAVISFHSLEDRIVKQYFKSQTGLKILTKRPITASEEEININPRSRSAKLRIVEKSEEYEHQNQNERVHHQGVERSQLSSGHHRGHRLRSPGE